MEIIKRLPDSRQTLLFSATLPKLLVEFAKAGLHDPTLIRLDVDTKLSEQLTVRDMYNKSYEFFRRSCKVFGRIIKKDVAVWSSLVKCRIASFF